MKQPTLFSKWMRINLKDAYSGLITSDIDFIVSRNDQKYIIVEEKNKLGARTGPAQAIIYKMLSEILSYDIDFLGCHKLTVIGEQVNVNELKTVEIEHFLNNPKEHYLNAYNQSWFEKVIYFNFKYLWDGKGKPPLKKTEAERTFLRDSKLKKILEEKNIRYESIDWIFVNYVTGYYALFSEFDNELGKTGNKIDRIFEGNENGEYNIKNPKSKCLYKYLGHYNISYTTNEFNEIKEFFINSKQINVTEAKQIFNLDNKDIEKYKN